MLRKLRDDEQGFTLIELLVVILIVGILAAIALPTFLGQQKKGQDAEAKSNARNLVTHVESCFTGTQDYQLCLPSGSNLGTTGLPIGTTPGNVNVTSSGTLNYQITAYSKSNTNFTITKTNGAAPVRGCSPAGSGGCNSSGSW
jgi:type IV pilus assembly protein PilA